MSRLIEPVRFSSRLIFLSLLLFVIRTPITFAYQQRILEPGTPIEQDLGGGETHSYQLSLLAGQYVRIFADQRRVNVALAAFDPSGKKVVEADGFPMGNRERLMLVAEVSGTYRVEVRSPRCCEQSFGSVNVLDAASAEVYLTPS